MRIEVWQCVPERKGVQIRRVAVITGNVDIDPLAEEPGKLSVAPVHRHIAGAFLIIAADDLFLAVDLIDLCRFSAKISFIDRG